jgi:SAM-dependent methyltransferase
MSSLNAAATAYDNAFFQVQAQAGAGPRAVVPFLVALLEPRSVVDVGCGVGVWLSAFREQGVEDILGLDGAYVSRSLLLIPPDRFTECDLANGVSQSRSFDLVVSLEVAEHLPAGCADRFVRSLIGLGKVVLFSAAIPGQGGTKHVNEQWPEYWQERFASHGYQVVDCLRPRFWNNEAIPGCYRQNMFLFVEAAYLKGHAGLQEQLAMAGNFPLSAVHPVFFRQALQTPTLMPLLKLLPGAAARTVRNRLARLWK